jgi:acetyltransferase-like isoleucine patch superfamily enzyme
VVGDNCWISSQTLLCGRVELQDDVRLAVSVSISDHLLIGRGAMVGLGSVVTKNVQPSGKVFGVPAKPLQTMKSL